jgi:hypothetical protein
MKPHTLLGLILLRLLVADSHTAENQHQADYIKSFLTSPPEIEEMDFMQVSDGKTEYVHLEFGSEGFYAKISPEREETETIHHKLEEKILGRIGQTYWLFGWNGNIALEELSKPWEDSKRQPMAIASSVFPITHVLNCGLPSERLGGHKWEGDELVFLNYFGSTNRARLVRGPNDVCLGVTYRFNVRTNEVKEAKINFRSEAGWPHRFPQKLEFEDGKVRFEVLKLKFGKVKDPKYTFSLNRYLRPFHEHKMFGIYQDEKEVARGRLTPEEYSKLLRN